MKKRETERQAEMRLNSYAYLEATEREEPWRQLAAHAPNSGAADAAWSALLRYARNKTARVGCGSAWVAMGGCGDRRACGHPSTKSQQHHCREMVELLV